MKNKINILLPILALVLFTSATTQIKNNLSKVEWLIGTWENKSSRGSIYETWTKINENKLSGESYMIKEKDTILFENISLMFENDNLHYIPIVENQNNNMPVRFSAHSITPDKMIFENQQHDFPQMISYSKIKSDSLVAEISGMKNGKLKSLFFHMKKIH
ncbi:MAG: hypothetical protein IPH93_17205 [Saprospiraceae bacterium]|nr:hypothetical protein [Saprospiraceae bacterium]MBK7811420.1 hypothetical protein [Saprospiraceae bacterium]MBK9631330.1 hypothetical protein [Saprospiraceae bacterium]